MTTALVAGAGGFIGGHLVRRLLDEGAHVTCVDVKPTSDWWQVHRSSKTRVFAAVDLSRRGACDEVVCSGYDEMYSGYDEVYNLAADMGGMGFIERNRALCMLSVLINTHLLIAARDSRVGRYFYASSACVYAADKQRAGLDSYALRESDAYPAMPEDGYGWEKLFSERMCRHFSEDFGLETRVARYHNVYGSHGSWTGGREKAPAAVCRKVAEALSAATPCIDVWGDGTQVRSFMHVDDCVEGTLRIMRGSRREPLNLGSSESITVEGLVQLVEETAGLEPGSLERRHDLSQPQGVAGRSSDNATIREVLGWEPSVSLRDGLVRTYPWVLGKVMEVSRR